MKNLASPLQIALAMLYRDSKELTRAFYNIMVTCSSAKLLHFKKLADINANMNLLGLKSEVDSVI